MTRALHKSTRRLAEANMRLLAYDLRAMVEDVGAERGTVTVWRDQHGRWMASARMHDRAGGMTLPQELVAVREELTDA